MRFAPDWMMPGGSAEIYDRLISETSGKGPQSSKWAFVFVIRAGAFCASVMTLAGGVGFAFKQAGDAASWGAFWGANFALWSALLTAAAAVKVKQANATKEIAIAQLPSPPTPAAPTVTTKTVKIEKTSSESGPTPQEEP